MKQRDSDRQTSRQTGVKQILRQTDKIKLVAERRSAPP